MRGFFDSRNIYLCSKNDVQIFVSGALFFMSCLCCKADKNEVSMYGRLFGTVHPGCGDGLSGISMDGICEKPCGAISGVSSGCGMFRVSDVGSLGRKNRENRIRVSWQNV